MPRNDILGRCQVPNMAKQSHHIVSLAGLVLEEKINWYYNWKMDGKGKQNRAKD